MRRSATERFWAKVDKTGPCWLWTGAITSNGYGQFHLDGRMHQAHRISLEWAGHSVDPKLEVDHLCHVRNCVRPEHLRAATHAENGQNLRGAYRTSGTGVRGVTWRASCGRFQVRVQIGGKSRHIGYFATLEAAEAAAVGARADLFAIPGGSR